MKLRLKKSYAGLKQENLEGLILNSSANISYLTGYPSRDSYLLISKQGNIYITDSRYTEEARAGLKGLADVKKINGSLFKTIASSCRELGLKRIGFESRYLAYAEYRKIRAHLRKSEELIPAAGLVERLRRIKDSGELKKIRQAVQITLKAFEFIGDFLKPGIKEIEVAAELERFIRYNGARSSAFEIIVASGANAAYPHHITSPKRLRNHEMVLIDLGVDYRGYKSDLTRVFFLGKITLLARKVYDIVKEAQSRALRQIKPGADVAKIDAASRSYITQKGYGNFFGHNLGHGLGLEVHEAPSISAKANDKLESGMVFTVEPGIYLPQQLGVRIEDMVLVTAKGAKILSGAINK